MAKDVVPTILHKPFWGTCSTTDADSGSIVKPCHIYFLRTFHLMTSTVDSHTFLEEHPSVGAFLSCSKDNDIMTHGKCRNIRHAVGHLPADSIEVAEDGRQRDMCSIM